MKTKTLVLGALAAATVFAGGWAVAQSVASDGFGPPFMRGKGHDGMGPGMMKGMRRGMGPGMKRCGTRVRHDERHGASNDARRPRARLSLIRPGSMR